MVLGGVWGCTVGWMMLGDHVFPEFFTPAFTASLSRALSRGSGVRGRLPEPRSRGLARSRAGPEARVSPVYKCFLQVSIDH